MAVYLIILARQWRFTVIRLWLARMVPPLMATLPRARSMSSGFPTAFGPKRRNLLLRTVRLMITSGFQSHCKVLLSWSTNTWSENQKLVASDGGLFDDFGASVALYQINRHRLLLA